MTYWKKTEDSKPVSYKMINTSDGGVSRTSSSVVGTGSFGTSTFGNGIFGVGNKVRFSA